MTLLIYVKQTSYFERVLRYEANCVTGCTIVLSLSGSELGTCEKGVSVKTKCNIEAPCSVALSAILQQKFYARYAVVCTTEAQ